MPNGVEDVVKTYKVSLNGRFRLIGKVRELDVRRDDPKTRRSKKKMIKSSIVGICNTLCSFKLTKFIVTYTLVNEG